MTRYILSVDPGLHTGISFFSWEEGQDPVLEWSREVTEDEYVAPIRWAYHNYPNVEIACERFLITAKTVKNSQAPYSLELIGVLKQTMRDYGHNPDKTLTLQTPADAKKMFPNDKLKKLGYWHKGGAGHALDAIRHGILYITRQGWQPAGLLS